MISRSENNTYPAVDIAKFFFSLCIIFIHTGLFVEIRGGYYIESIVLRLAVPYFFVCSGFFLGLKIKDSNWTTTKQYIYKYTMRIGVKLLVFESISILVNIVLMIHVGDSFKDILLQTMQSVLFYPWGSLWYLQAVIVGVLLLLPFIKRKSVLKAIPIGIMLYGVALICNRYYFWVLDNPIHILVEKYLTVFVSARNGLFIGFVYIAIGIVLSMYFDKIKKHRMAVVVCFIMSLLFLISEVYMVSSYQGADDNSLFISHLVLVPCLFLITAAFNIRITGTVLLRNLSTSFYLIQKSVIQILPSAFSLVFGIAINRYELTFLTLICIGAVCVIIYNFKSFSKIYKLMT